MKSIDMLELQIRIKELEKWRKNVDSQISEILKKLRVTEGPSDPEPYSGDEIADQTPSLDMFSERVEDPAPPSHDQE